MDEFPKLTDFVNGTEVKLRISNDNEYKDTRFFIIDDKIVRFYHGENVHKRSCNVFAELQYYNEGLCNTINSKYDIMEIININRESVWVREQIDWKEIPKGTKVSVWDRIEDKGKHIGYFWNYDEDSHYPYNVYFENEKGNISSINFSHCELVEEPITVKSIDNAFYNNNKDKKKFVVSCWGLLTWLLKNYIVIKK